MGRGGIVKKILLMHVELQACFAKYYSKTPPPPYVYLLRARVYTTLRNFPMASDDFTQYINLEQNDLFAAMNACICFTIHPSLPPSLPRSLPPSLPLSLSLFLPPSPSLPLFLSFDLPKMLRELKCMQQCNEATTAKPTYKRSGS